MIIRRDFLKGIGGLAAVSLGRAGSRSAASGRSWRCWRRDSRSVGRLSPGRRGPKVTLFEKEAPAAGATSRSFAWINAFTGNPHYRALRMRGEAGQALKGEVGQALNKIMLPRKSASLGIECLSISAALHITHLSFHAGAGRLFR